MVRQSCSWVFWLFLFLSPLTLASDFCRNQNDISFLVNRPANAVSPCTVGYGYLLTEAGYQRHSWSTGSYADVYPITQIRLGLPKTSEVYAYLPFYTGNHAAPYTGSTTVAIGGKHEIWQNERMIFSVDGLIIIPGGSANYGSTTLGEHLNGIFSYSLSSKWNFLFMLSWYNQGQSASQPHLTYAGLGPDAVLSYVFSPKMTIYAEVFGQSKVSPLMGSGFNADTGLVFSIKKNITFDIEFGTRISGQLAALGTFVGAGGAIQL